jgi:hypothetical protein
MTVVVAICAATVACKSNDIQEDNSQTTNNAGDVIGPKGGTLEDPVHHTKVLFPADAVTEPTQFKLGVAEGVAGPAGQPLASPVYSFEPHGYTFHGAVTIVLPYEADAATATVWHAPCQGNVCQAWDAEPVSGVQVASGTATFLTPTFSLYAVTTKPAGCTDADCPSPLFCGLKDGAPACVECAVGAGCTSSCSCPGLTCVAGQCVQQ